MSLIFILQIGGVFNKSLIFLSIYIKKKACVMLRFAKELAFYFAKSLHYVDI